MVDGMGGVFWWMALWGLLGLVLLVLAVVAIFWLVRSMIQPGRPGTDPAEEELRRRYALGEIGREEYLERMTDLRRPPP
ncbi:hypothetical protein GCM10012275_22780 [Longimycelium tulufanense]|uniref:SHOCT domain-containing protein n=2 Tax=Longimycelium tulufanense TaxID=907463 RepID=A0A8J3FW86_9PSEU|nr:hypothetical protein GCM10012275_22780 [Longimycelium tulufanense]